MGACMVCWVRLVGCGCWMAAAADARLHPHLPCFVTTSLCLLQVYDVNSSKTFDNLENWRDEFLIQVGLRETLVAM